jgi:hypothetical protein
MNRRHGGGRSRRDRYGIDEDENHGENTASTPYTLHTEGRTSQSVGRQQEPSASVRSSTKESLLPSSTATTTPLASSLHRPGVLDTDDVIPPEEVEPLTPSNNNNNGSSNNNRDIFRDEPEDDDDDDDDGESYVDYDMTLQELMYSTSSFYAIVVPGKKRGILSFSRIYLVVSKEKRDRAFNACPTQ